MFGHAAPPNPAVSCAIASLHRRCSQKACIKQCSSIVFRGATFIDKTYHCEGRHAFETIGFDSSTVTGCLHICILLGVPYVRGRQWLVGLAMKNTGLKATMGILGRRRWKQKVEERGPPLGTAPPPPTGVGGRAAQEVPTLARVYPPSLRYRVRVHALAAAAQDDEWRLLGLLLLLQ